MSKIIAIANHKGGCSKTTSTINIGAGLNKNKKKVLLIDYDPQANLSQNFGLANQDLNIYSAMKGKHPLKPINISKGFDIIPSCLDLSGIEIELASEVGNQFILKELLKDLKNSYDFILIDCPPSLGLLTINAFSASDEIIIPIQAEYFSTQGLGKIIEIFEKVKKRLNKELKIGGVLVTQFSHRKTLNKEVVEVVSNFVGDWLFKTRIRENISLAEAPAHGQHIFDYNPKSHGAIDYMSVTQEILKN